MNSIHCLRSSKRDCQIYFMSRDYQLAIRQLRSVVDSDPKFGHGHLWLGVAYLYTNLYTKEYKEAVRELEQAVKLDPNEPESIAYLTFGHARLGNREAAARALRQLTDLSKTRYVSGYLFAIMSVGLGSRDVIDWLEKAYADRDDMLAWLGTDRIFDEFRADPRFKRLLARLGLGGFRNISKGQIHAAPRTSMRISLPNALNAFSI